MDGIRGAEALISDEGDEEDQVTGWNSRG